MIKSAIAALAAAPFFATAAVAGPYVNVEANSAFTGSEYEGSLVEYHVGYEKELGEKTTVYVQGGPAQVIESGNDTDDTLELSGKVGIGIDVTERLNVYGEVWAMTSEEIDFDEDFSLATKIGAKFTF